MRKLSEIIILVLIIFTEPYAINHTSIPDGELSDLSVLMSDESQSNSNFGDTSRTETSYLSQGNSDLLTNTYESSFNYKNSPQYEDIAFTLFNRAPGGGISAKDWNGLKRKGMAQAAIALTKGETRRRTDQDRQSELRINNGGKTDYNPNLFHWSTWKCAVDRMPWGNHKPEDGQNSPNCVEAIRVGW